MMTRPAGLGDADGESEILALGVGLGLADKLALGLTEGDTLADPPADAGLNTERCEPTSNEVPDIEQVAA